jgi:hypothetical protein
LLVFDSRYADVEARVLTEIAPKLQRSRTFLQMEKRRGLNPIRLRLEIFTSRGGFGGYDPDALPLATPKTWI